MSLTWQVVRKLLIYDPSTGKLYWRPRDLETAKNDRYVKMWNTRTAGREAFTSTNKKGYRVGAIYNKLYTAHRIIWLYVYGNLPNEIDHINGKRDENFIMNLRDVTHIENHRNVGINRHNKTGVSGVHWSKRENKWIARINDVNKNIRLGCFSNFDDAVQARRKAESLYGYHRNHGDKVRHG